MRIDDERLTFYLRNHLKGTKWEYDRDKADIIWAHLKDEWHKMKKEKQTEEEAHKLIEIMIYKWTFKDDMNKLLFGDE